MNRHGTTTVLILFLFATLAVGCGEDAGGSGTRGGGQDAGVDFSGDLLGDVDLNPTEDDLDGDGLLNTLEDLNRNGRYDSGGRETDLLSPDTDGDGLADGTEDANQNGQVDAGETDPRLSDTDGDGLSDSEEGDLGTDPTVADSDGDGLSDGVEQNVTGTDPRSRDSDNDGLPDGDEDRDGDGVIGPTETDPNDQDTDDDGVLDASESVQIACASSRQPAFDLFEDGPGDWLVALPESIDATGLFTLEGGAGELLRGGWFQESAGDIFGFVLVKPPQLGVGLGIEQAETEATVLRSIAEVSGRSAAPLASWDLFHAGIIELTLTFDEAVSASEARDRVAASMARRGVFELGTPSEDVGPTASAWHLRFSVTLRTEGRAVIVAALAPAPDVETDAALARRIRDLTDTTPLSQWGDSVSAACRVVPVATDNFQVDFLWLVDRSLSMAEERARVVEISQDFFDTLAGTLLDYRIAVASTGMHNDDSWILVEPGFSQTRADFVAQMSDPPGGDLEYGLATGLKIARLARGAATSGGTHARASAKLVVVVMSDEMDQSIDFQIDQGVPGCDPQADPTLSECALLQDRIAEYQELDLTFFAITGDLPDGCGDDVVDGLGVAEEGGHGYIQTAFATGGGFGSICAADLSEPIDQMIRAAFGAASTYQLDPRAISQTVRVVVDGELVPRSREHGFDVDPAAGTLVFYGDWRPDLEAEVIVSYSHFNDETADPEPFRDPPG